VNYAADPRAGLDATAALLRRIAAALVPGGVLLLDASAPGRPAGRGWTAGEDWLICVERTTAGATLTRTIVAFERAGAAWRRGDERHVLHLLEEADVLAALAASGLQRAARLDGYGGEPLPEGQLAYVAYGARPRR
jgi:hypothetical protein